MREGEEERREESAYLQRGDGRSQSLADDVWMLAARAGAVEIGECVVVKQRVRTPARLRRRRVCRRRPHRGSAHRLSLSLFLFHFCFGGGARSVTPTRTAVPVTRVT